MTRAEATKHAENLRLIKLVLSAMPAESAVEVQNKREWAASLDAGASALATNTAN